MCSACPVGGNHRTGVRGNVCVGLRGSAAKYYISLFFHLLSFLNRMKTKQLYRDYEYLVDEAEEAFHRVAGKHGDCIKCGLHCSNCCHAVFGLFLIETAYLREHVEQIQDHAMQALLTRCERADKDVEKLQKILEAFEDDPQMRNYTLAKERVRCPLLCSAVTAMKRPALQHA